MKKIEMASKKWFSSGRQAGLMRLALAFAVSGMAGNALAGNNTLSVSTAPPTSANAGSSFSVTASLPYVVGNDCGNQVRIVVTSGSCTGGSTSWTGNNATCTSSGSLTQSITMSAGALTACVVSVDGRDSNSANGYPPSSVYTVKIKQSIAWSGVPASSGQYAADYTVSATAKTSDGVANTGMAITYSTDTPGVCSVSSGGLVHNLGSGTCTIRATAASSSNFAAVASTASWSVIGYTQSITVTQPAPASAVLDEVFGVAATASSGFPVTITASGGCSVSNGIVMMTSGSVTCTINYDQAGDDNYGPAHKSSDTTALPAFPLNSQSKGSSLTENTQVQ